MDKVVLFACYPYVTFGWLLTSACISSRRRILFHGFSFKLTAMIDGLIYLLNVNMALAILYLCYRTVRNNSYLFVRRICLWGILMISFGFPFINELFIIPLPDPSLNSVSHVVSSVWNTQKQITSIDVQDKDNWFLLMVMIIYVLGLVYFLLRF